MEVKELSFEQNVPIYLQLVEKIRFCIISGQLLPGERLPSVREWALSERVNPNTMQKALSELETEGLIITERTNGKFVTNDRDLITRCNICEAGRLAVEYLGKAAKIGLNPDEALKCFENLKGGCN